MTKYSIELPEGVHPVDVVVELRKILERDRALRSIVVGHSIVPVRMLDFIGALAKAKAEPDPPVPSLREGEFAVYTYSGFGEWYDAGTIVKVLKVFANSNLSVQDSAGARRTIPRGHVGNAVKVQEIERPVVAVREWRVVA